VGDTDIPAPLLAVPTVPTPLLIEPLVALVEENVSIVLWPSVMVAGVAVMLAVGAAADPPLDEPPQLTNVRKKARINAKNCSRVDVRHERRFPTTSERLILVRSFFSNGIEIIRRASNCQGNTTAPPHRECS